MTFVFGGLAVAVVLSFSTAFSTGLSCRIASNSFGCPGGDRFCTIVAVCSGSPFASRPVGFGGRTRTESNDDGILRVSVTAPLDCSSNRTNTRKAWMYTPNHTTHKNPNDQTILAVLLRGKNSDRFDVAMAESILK